MREHLLAVEVRPPADYIPAYLDYVAELGCNQEGLYFGQCPDPDMQVPIAESLQVGRACELARMGLDDIADRKLAKAHNRLTAFRHHSGRQTTEVMRATFLIDSVAMIVRARNNPEALDRAYANMRGGIVRDLSKLRRLCHAARRANRLAGRDDLDGPAQKYFGSYKEQVALAAATRATGALAMPALLHHDYSRDPAESHDMVLLARRHWPRPESDDDTAPDAFITRKVQTKCFCLALCNKRDGARTKGAQDRLGEARNKYYNDVVLCSTHCDFDPPGIGLDEAAILLDDERRRGLDSKPTLELNNIAHAFVWRLLNPDDRRMGRMSTAFRTARLVVAEQTRLTTAATA
jgi:hypothetical protein